MNRRQLAHRREWLAAQSEIERARLRSDTQELRAAVHGLWAPVRALRGPLALGVGALLLLLWRRRARPDPRVAIAAAVRPRPSLLNRLRTAVALAGAARGVWVQAQRYLR